jgi:hypothetical protein
METLTPAQRIVVTIIVVVLTLIAISLLLPLLNRTIESWLQNQDSASPTPAASPTATAVRSTEGVHLAAPQTGDGHADRGMPGIT